MFSPRNYLILFALLQTFTVAAKTPDVLQVALLNRTSGIAEFARLTTDSQVERLPLEHSLQTPLGSTWKLFVYAYAVDRKLPDPGYTCQGNDKEEVYCCSQKGERIDRDTALVRSCGLYFSPTRLGIDAKAWREYWQSRTIPDSLLELSAVAPATTVSVQSLLLILKNLPAQQQARAVLLDVLLDSDLVTNLGGRLRVKTWSWYRNQDPKQRIGGFAGWLNDGSPLWAAGQGSSADILSKYSHALDSFLPVTTAQPGPDNCVEVNLFARYPITAVHDSHKQVTDSGILHGVFKVQFVNGNAIGIESTGDIMLSRQHEKLLLRARMSREEYVARVLDREAGATPLQAARALAITARSYLLQNAVRDGECWLIDDSSANQRVAPRPASEAARAVAAWTADIVLAGAAVNYHLDRPGPNRLVWRDAIAQANRGMRFDAILRQAFPRNSLASWQKPASACEALADAENWLKSRLPRWRELLISEPGYVETTLFSVCRLQAGNPHIDKNSRRIFVRSVLSQQDRLDITHEYLHLAFEAYPSGQDENYVENLARRLLMEL